MKISNDTKLDFDDVLIAPQRSNINSRSVVNVERKFKFKHVDWTWEGVPIIAANMDTTGSMKMAMALTETKCLTALHKHYTKEQLIEFFTKFNHCIDNVFYTVGTSPNDYQKLISVMKLVNEKLGKDVFPKFLNIDVANGYHENFVRIIEDYRKLLGKKTAIMAGNVVTSNMTEELLIRGADIVKVGIGGGSVCTTRIKTGVGFPQLSAVIDTAFSAHGIGGHICSDGGCRESGDICKAFCGGADFVMLGGMFAGASQCDGEWINASCGCERKLKFYGMSSEEANNKYNNGLDGYKTSEGREIIIDDKGPVENIVHNILGGIRSCCAYIGTNKIKNMFKCAEFIRVNKQYNDIYE